MIQANFNNFIDNLEWQFSNNLVDYDEALEFMTSRVDKIINQQAKSLIWVLEHPALFTAGVSAKPEDLLNITDQKIYQTNRGGKYTYHCPGMKIIYIMLDLKKFFYPNPPDVAKFINFLELWIIDLLRHYQIAGKIHKDRVGIWVETKKGDPLSEKKISAIGIKLKKWVSYHGIALNIDCDLSGFQRIIPCGIKDYGVTSFADLGKKIDDNFDLILQQNFNHNLYKFYH
ncbi:MAG: lipoyl(octanoyl) transferase LipB [Alphaproteobacteria bacterium]